MALALKDAMQDILAGWRQDLDPDMARRGRRQSSSASTRSTRR